MPLPSKLPGGESRCCCLDINELSNFLYIILPHGHVARVCMRRGIDFWTTRCTVCPVALDNLNGLAGDERYKHVTFASICCVSCDGARNIIERDDNPRWDKISHYFMDHEYKELAKGILGFKRVPFYVVLNTDGNIVQMGSKKQIDFNNIPGMVQPPNMFHVHDVEEEKKKGSLGMASPTAVDEKAFQIFDLDF